MLAGIEPPRLQMEYGKWAGLKPGHYTCPAEPAKGGRYIERWRGKKAA